jgi:hypothetical protein
MDDLGSQQCSILLWPAKADSAQLKRWIKKGPNQTSTFFGILGCGWFPMGFYDVLNMFFPKFPICYQTCSQQPHTFVPCLFFFFWLQFLSKQASLLACNVCRWAKGEKKIV